jgi:hypothetical protein
MAVTIAEMFTWHLGGHWTTDVHMSGKTVTRNTEHR